MGTKSFDLDAESETGRATFLSRDRLRRLGRFATVGVAGYLANLLVFAVAIHALYYVVAGSISWVAGMFLSYDLNRRYTFSPSEHGYVEGYLRHLAVYSVGFVVYAVVLWRAGLWVDTYLALGVAVATSGVLNFVGSEFWVFE